MNYKRHFYNRFSNTAIFLFILFVFIIKILFFILIKEGLLDLGLGGGSDSNYYHAFAIGNGDNAVNTWPLMLRYLNDRGLYSRDGIAYVLLLLNLLVIPILIVKISGLSFKYNQKYYLYLFLLALVYPTIYIYTTNVFRDVFMVLVFLLAILTVKNLINAKNIVSFSIYASISIFMGWVLFGLRGYLGFSFFLALLLWKVRFTKKRIIFLGTLYLLGLFIINYLGFFDSLTDYRSAFEEGDGGSTLGLNFSNPILFIPNFILSTLGQLFGLYVTNPLAIALLALETAPFFFMLVYIIKNIKLADSFARFLIMFFVLYASIWLIANDNLGTAVRLRIYNYLAVYICFFYMLKIKNSILVKK